MQVIHLTLSKPLSNKFVSEITLIIKDSTHLYYNKKLCTSLHTAIT